MSKVSVETINCKNCGKKLKVNIYNSINTQLHCELKDKLLSGELTNVSCECGKITQLRYPMLYHKMGFANSIMIHYTQSDVEEVKKQHEMAKQFLGNISFKNPFQMIWKEASKKQGLNVDDIFEVYNDWDKFIERIKEIG